MRDRERQPSKSSADAFWMWGGWWEGGRGGGSSALQLSLKQTELRTAPRGPGDTPWFISSFVLSVQVIALKGHPISILCHLLPVPVLFHVKFS